MLRPARSAVSPPSAYREVQARAPQRALRMGMATMLGLLACGHPTLTPSADAHIDAFAAVADPCGPETKPPPTSGTFRIEVGGREREFRLFAPYGGPGRAQPLLLSFHGFSNNAILQEQWTGTNSHAARNGYLVIYPQGINNSWNAGACCGTAQTENLDDVAFARAIVKWTQARYCIDAKRVYATGFSNGGFLAHRLACEASDVFAAIASVAAVNGVASCAPPRPVSVLTINGTGDPIVPVQGNAGLGFPSLAATLAGWHQRNQCETTAMPTLHVGSATCERRRCANATAVEACLLTSVDHRWPGGTMPGVNSNDLVATEYIWQNLSAQRLP